MSSVIIGSFGFWADHMPSAQHVQAQRNLYPHIDDRRSRRDPFLILDGIRFNQSCAREARRKGDRVAAAHHMANVAKIRHYIRQRETYFRGYGMSWAATKQLRRECKAI